MASYDWINFAIVVGAASGALTGLLFVAVSLNIRELIQRPTLKASAAQTLIVFILPLLVAVLITVPGQALWLLGTEFTALGVSAGIAMALLGRGKRSSQRDAQARLGRVLDHTSPNVVTSLLVITAGTLLLCGDGGGLYWLVPAATIGLAGGVANTWLFLTRLPA